MGDYIYIILIVAASIILPLGYYLYHTKKLKKFLSENPDKAAISYTGGENTAGAHVHRVLSQSLDNEFSRKYPHAGTFTVNAGQVELEVERITMSYNPLLKKTTYTFHGKVPKTFTVEAGKKYKLKYDKKTQDFNLNA